MAFYHSRFSSFNNLQSQEKAELPHILFYIIIHLSTKINNKFLASKNQCFSSRKSIKVEEKLSILDELFYKIDKKGFFGGSNAIRLKAIQNGANFVFSTEEIKKAYLQVTKQLKDAYAVAIII